MNARECYRTIRELVARGTRVASATVVRKKGSTPREVGAKMLVLPDRTLRGTIGGGCGEAEVLEVAAELLAGSEAGAARQVRVDLTEEILEESERICGGIMDVLVEVWDRPSPELDVLATGRDVIRVLQADGSRGPLDRVWSAGTAPRDSDAAVEEQCERALRDRISRFAPIETASGEVEAFFEYVHGESTLVIVGAGHIAQPLSRLAKMVGFSVVVVDDRPEFASSERFPDADRVIAEPMEAALDLLDLGETTMVVLVTRGHRLDEYCLRRLLHSPCSYLGMLGSRRRVKAVFSSLLADGFTREQLGRVWAPIGIDIGAHGPAEIAVSIVAELVALRRGRLGGHLKIAPPRR